MLRTIATAQSLGANYTSDWYPLDDYNSVIDEVTCLFIWTGATGTLNGEFALELKLGDAEDAYDTETLACDSATGRETLRTPTDCVAVRVKYTKNDITGGTFNCYLLSAGKN